MVTVMQRVAATATVWGGELNERGQRFLQRARDERGQTAAEYMGILLLVAVIIAAVVVSGIPGQIKGAIEGIITDISTGSKPEGVEGAPAPPAE